MVEISILLVLVSQTWAKAYDCGWLGHPSCNDTVYAVACDSTDYDSICNSYVVVGHVDPGPLGATDVLVSKLDSKDGSVIWSKAYGFPCGDLYDDYGRSVIVDYEGDSSYYVIAGYTRPGFMMIDGADVLVFKIRGRDGSLVWGWLYSAMYYDPGEIRTDDYAYSVCKADGDYIVAGKVEPGPCGGQSDALVFKVNAGTGLMPWPSCWCRAYGVDSSGNGTDDYAYSVVEDLSTQPCTLFVLTGKSSNPQIQTTDILIFKGRYSNGLLDGGTRWIYSYKPTGYHSCAYSIRNDHQPGYILTGDLDTSVVVMRLNQDLSLGWGGRCRRYSTEDRVSARSIEPTTDGEYIFSGFTSPGIQAPPGFVDLIVAKFDSGGQVTWSKVLEGCENIGTWMGGSDYGTCVIECPSDTYAVTGYTDWPLQSSWNPTNLLIARMDADGNIPCPQSGTCMSDIQILLDSPLVSIDTSYLQRELGIQLIQISDSSVYLNDTIICCEEVTGVGEGDSNLPPVYGLGNIPNPFTEKTTIYYHLMDDCQVLVEIYDLAGRLIKTLSEGYKEVGRHAHTWDARGENGERLAPGIYFNQIMAGGLVESRKMILIK